MEPANAAPPPVFVPPGTALPPPVFVLPIDENGIVTADVTCRGCSYNLRGLHQDGKCPECGTPVGLSIRGNLLRYSDPVWVDKLSRGVDLILWGLLAGLLASFAGIVLVFAMGPARGQVLAQIIGVLASIVGFIGAWLLTTPDPGSTEQPQTVTAGKIVRFALVFAMIQNLLSIFSTDEKLNPFLSALIGILLIIAALLGVVGEIARLYYFEKLALRIPDEALARRAHIVKWGYGISLAVAGVFGAVILLVTQVMKQSPGGGIILTASCITGLAGLVLLGFMIVYIIMLFQFRKALKAQSKFARDTWAAATAPGTLAPPAL
jgi:hypothetical protein